ncbi:MAG: hypothetical protein ACHQNA_06165 [Acidimicrobiales bacterium]
MVIFWVLSIWAVELVVTVAALAVAIVRSRPDTDVLMNDDQASEAAPSPCSVAGSTPGDVAVEPLAAREDAAGLLGEVPGGTSLAHVGVDRPLDAAVLDPDEVVRQP